jgi:hypothetical protein
MVCLPEVILDLLSAGQKKEISLASYTHYADMRSDHISGQIGGMGIKSFKKKQNKKDNICWRSFQIIAKCSQKL